MKNADVQRLFIESMFRLRRDMTFLSNEKIENSPVLELKINEETVIGFNSESKNWYVKSLNFSCDNWNPKVSTICEFLELFDNKLLIDSCENFNKKSHEFFDNLSAEFLYNKIQTMFYLMKLPENDETLIFHDKSQNIIEIYYDHKNFVFMHRINNEIDSEYFLDEYKTKLFLKNTSYSVMMRCLNNFYSKLKRKI